MAESESKWPFGATNGGPDSRPLVVDLENILVAILSDAAEAERAMGLLRDLGFPEQHLRLYTSEQMLAYDESFNENRSLLGRLVGTLVDDRESMSRYVSYARDGHASLWVLTEDRDDASRVIQHLVGHQIEVLYIWYHGQNGLETIRIR